jgi:hypothetical protein
MRTLNATTLAVMLLAISGCSLLVAAPFLAQNTFDEKRAQLKREYQRDLFSHKAAFTACVSMLRQVDGRHTAPPPYSDDVCDFGSFADKRYELTKALEQGLISQDSWERECLNLPGKPATGNPCHLDQVQERLAVWRSQIQHGYATREAVKLDCDQFVLGRNGMDPAQICRF